MYAKLNYQFIGLVFLTISAYILITNCPRLPFTHRMVVVGIPTYSANPYHTPSVATTPERHIWSTNNTQKMEFSQFSNDNDIWNIFQAVGTSYHICSRLIHHSSANCSLELLLTNLPLKSTLLPSDETSHNTVAVLIRSPLIDILSEFSIVYQVDLCPSILKSHLFEEFALAKAVIWHRWYLYWYRLKQENEGKIFLIYADEFLKDPFPSISAVFSVFHVHLPTNETFWHPATYPNQLLEASSKMDTLTEYLEMIPPEIRKAVIKETMPFHCHGNFEILLKEEMVNECLIIEHGFAADVEQERKINVLTTYFKSSSTGRQVEVDHAVKMNFDNAEIGNIHLWVDGKTSLSSMELPKTENTSEKLILVHSSYQPLYSDLFEYANRYLKDEIVIVQNVDIFWDQDSMKQLRRSLTPEMIFALSRHSDLDEYPETKCGDGGISHNRNLCLKYKGSHDVFAMIPPIDPVVYQQLTFKQNSWGAENVVIEALKYGGYQVENPCFEIRPIHSHCSNLRINTGYHVLPPPDGNRNSQESKQVKPKYLKQLVK